MIAGYWCTHYFCNYAMWGLMNTACGGGWCPGGGGGGGGWPWWLCPPPSWGSWPPWWRWLADECLEWDEYVGAWKQINFNHFQEMSNGGCQLLPGALVEANLAQMTFLQCLLLLRCQTCPDLRRELHGGGGGHLNLSGDQRDWKIEILKFGQHNSSLSVTLTCTLMSGKVTSVTVGT